jgi:hypothetical protein
MKRFPFAAVLTTLWLFGSGPASAATLFFDNFNSGASAAWGNQSGTWRADGGVYDATFPSNGPNTYSDVTTLPSLTNFIVDVDINFLNDGGVWLRSSRSGGGIINGVLLVTGGSTGTNNGLYWHTVQNGSFSGILNNQTAAGLQGTNHHLRIVVDGDTYSAYLDGAVTPFTTLTTNLFASGHAGLYDFSPVNGASDPRGQTFDNFQISSADAVPLPPALVLFGSGLVGLVAVIRRRRVKAIAAT